MYRNIRRGRGRVARRENIWVHSNFVARREKTFFAYPSSRGCRFLARHGAWEISRRATIRILFSFRGTRNKFFPSRDAKMFFRVPLQVGGVGFGAATRFAKISFHSGVREIFFAYPSKWRGSKIMFFQEMVVRDRRVARLVFRNREYCTMITYISYEERMLRLTRSRQEH